MKKKLKSKWKIFAFIILLLVLGLGLYLLLSGDKKDAIEEEKETPVMDIVKEPEEEDTLRENIRKMKNENADVLGWFKIGKTVIDYPLVQGNDNEYYLSHNYKKQKDVWGALFLHSKIDFKDDYANAIIYGHNNGGNKKKTDMFSTLQWFKDKDYYEKNSVITVTTSEEQRTYKIFAVFSSRIFYKDEVGVFRFYEYLDLKSEKVFEEYIANIDKIKHYDTGVKPVYGRQIMTLITCDYAVENGRFIVVAQEIQ